MHISNIEGRLRCLFRDVDPDQNSMLNNLIIHVARFGDIFNIADKIL
jgi:hypothetical protein